MKNKVSVFTEKMGNNTHYGIEYTFDSTIDDDTVKRLNRACDTLLYNWSFECSEGISVMSRNIGCLFNESFEGTYPKMVQFYEPLARNHRIIMRDMSARRVNKVSHILARMLKTKCNTLAINIGSKVDA